MINTALVQERTKQIRNAVEQRLDALALLYPKQSTSNPSLRENDSDISFVLVTENGHESGYLRDLNWLNEIQHIAYKYKNRDNGYRFLFSDGIYCEFSVIAESEFGVEYADMQTCWCRRPIEHALNALCQTPSASDDIEENWLLGEICTNILIGVRRFQKGDKLSAFYCIQHHALSRLLTLISQWEVRENWGKQANQDADIDASFNSAANHFARFAMGYENSPESASAMLEYIEQHHKINFFIKDQIQNCLNEVQSNHS